MLDRQNRGVPEQLLTPSKITSWLDCPHFLTLRHEVDSGVREQPPHMFGEMAQMLMDKGIDHEMQVLRRYEAEGRTVHRVPERTHGESFAAWAGRVGGALSGEHDVLYQLPLVHDGIRGVADFLERVPADDGQSYLRAGGRQTGSRLGQAWSRSSVVLLRRGHRRSDGGGPSRCTSSSVQVQGSRSGLRM